MIGEERVIRALRRDDFVSYFNHQYVAGNTAVVVAGNFEEEMLIQRVTQLFSGIRRDPPFRQKPSLVEAQNAPEVAVHYKETDQTHLTIGFRGYDANHPKRYVADVLATLLGGSWSSRMWDRIREKLGLAYTVMSSHDSYSNRGYLVTYAGVDHANVEKTIRAALEEYKNVCEKPIPAEELSRVKNYIRGTTLIALEQSNAVASFVGGEEMLTGAPLTVDEVFAKIDAVSGDDICAAARDMCRPERLNLAIIGPFKEKERFAEMIKEF